SKIGYIEHSENVHYETISSENNQSLRCAPNQTNIKRRILLNAILAKPRSIFRFCKSVKLSSPNVEKVVTAPKRPINKKACSPSGNEYCFVMLHSKPITKQPNKFTLRVPHGNPLLNIRLANSETR